MRHLQAEGAQRGEAARRRSAGFIPAGNRRFAARITAAALVLGLSACGGGEEPLAADGEADDGAGASITVRGTVVEMDGPLAGAYVLAFDRGGRRLARVRTDSRGAYVLRVTARPHVIEVKSYDHVPRVYRAPNLRSTSARAFTFDVHVGPVLGADTTGENVTYMVLEDATGPRVVPQVAWGNGGSLEPWFEAVADLMVGPRDRRLDTLIPDGTKPVQIEQSVIDNGDHLEVRLNENLERYSLGSEYLAAMIQQIAATASHSWSDQALPVSIQVPCDSCPSGFRPMTDGAVGPDGPGDSYSVTAARYQDAFSDIDGHRYAGHMAMAKALGIATGYRDNTDRPDNHVTRAELAAMLVAGLGLPLVSPRTPTFRDVPATYWAFRAIETARARGLMYGSNGDFDPTDRVTRGQLASYLANAAGWPAPSTTRQSFSDVPATYWAHQRIETAYGWCRAVEAKSWAEPDRFYPADWATRAEAIAGVVRTLNCLVGNEPR